MTPSQMTVAPWVMLPMCAQAHIRSYLRAYIPGIKDYAYFWNRHLTENGKTSILKKAGID
jgi:hypothetical protein